MKHFLLQPFIKPLVLAVVIAIGMFAVPQSAHAACTLNPTNFSLLDCTTGVIATSLYSILVFVAWAIGWASEMLNAVVRFQLDANLFVIVDLWKIVRDFANMLFILIFIIMALSTIFDIGSLGIPGLGGGTDVKALIAKFVIAALLINFSLVIGGLIIDAANVVNDVFLAAIGDFSTRIGSALNPSATLLNITPQQLQQLNVNISSAAPSGGFSHIVKMFTSIIMGLIILFSLIVALFFSVFRIPLLAMLLVFSPLAWICSILPSTQNFNKSWWNQFIGWNIFLPVFLFFLYFGLYFLSFQDQILGSAAEGFNPTTVTSSFGSGFGVTVQTIFYYFIVAFTLLGGTKVALDAASGGGKLLTETVTRGKNFAWGLPVFSQYRAVQQASKVELEQIQKEGLGSRKYFGLQKYGDYIYGGEAGQKRMVERERAQLFGDRTILPGKIAELRKKHKENETSMEELTKDLKSSDSVKRFAAAEALLEGKKLSADATTNKLIADYIATSDARGKSFRDRFEAYMMEKAEKENLSESDITNAAMAMRDGETRKNFLEKASKRNLVAGISAWKTLSESSDPKNKKQLVTWPLEGERPISKEEAIYRAAKKLSNKDILNLDENSFGDKEVQRAFAQILSTERITKMYGDKETTDEQKLRLDKLAKGIVGELQNRKNATGENAEFRKRMEDEEKRKVENEKIKDELQKQRKEGPYKTKDPMAGKES